MAKKRTKKRQTEWKRLVDLSASSMRAYKLRLDYAAASIYARTQGGFAERITKAGFPYNNSHPVDAFKQGHTAWTKATGLPPLTTKDNWRRVAVAAGAGDELLEAADTGDRELLDRLVKRVVAYVATDHRQPDHDDADWTEADFPPEFAKYIGVSKTTFWRYRRKSPIRIRTLPEAGTKMIRCYRPDLDKFKKRKP